MTKLSGLNQVTNQTSVGRHYQTTNRTTPNESVRIDKIHPMMKKVMSEEEVGEQVNKFNQVLQKKNLTLIKNEEISAKDMLSLVDTQTQELIGKVSVQRVMTHKRVNTTTIGLFIDKKI